MKRIIYGAGKYGQILLTWCQKVGIVIDCFAQTSSTNNKRTDGIPVIDFETLCGIEDEMVILIAIKDSNNTNEIKKLFAEIDREDIEIYEMRDFIETNLMKRRVDLSKCGNRHCIVCGNDIDAFDPAGIMMDLFNRHHIIGGGYRDNCTCPVCGSGDRERWMYYVIKNKTSITSMEGRILHFAPEKPISELITRNPNIDYYTGDIIKGRAMHVIDITSIQFRNRTFDYVISNHVMEHIPDEEKAVSEIKRVLKNDGKWIVTVPVCTDVETYEDKSITDSEARLRAYGQKDHVRLYGKDFKERFEGYGLTIQIFRPIDELGEEEIKKYGFIEDDIVMIATKGDSDE